MRDRLSRWLLAALAVGLLLALAGCRPARADIPAPVRERVAAALAHPVVLGDVTDASVAAVRLALGDGGVLFIDSYGGSAYAGIVLHDWLLEHDVVCVVTGKAASAAFVALQGCRVRVVAGDAWVLAHYAYFSIESPGRFTLHAPELREALRRLDALNEGFLRRCAARMGVPVELLAAKLDQGDWRVESEDAVRARVADLRWDPDLPLPLDPGT